VQRGAAEAEANVKQAIQEKKQRSLDKCLSELDAAQAHCTCPHLPLRCPGRIARASFACAVASRPAGSLSAACDAPAPRVGPARSQLHADVAGFAIRRRLADERRCAKHDAAQR